MLHTSLSTASSDWDVWVPIIQMAINNTYHSTLWDIPRFIFYGETKRLPYKVLDQLDYVKLAIRKKQEIHTPASRKR